MLLPGGVLTTAGIDRSFAFKQITGLVELAIFESSRAAGSWPARVTGLLVAALHSIGGMEPTGERVGQLAVGDRQFLLRCLGPLLVGDPVRHSGDCPACGQRLSVALRYSDLPVKNAGTSYPRTGVRTSLRARPVQFRVPTGDDQEAIQGEPEGMPLRRILIGRLVVDEPIETSAFSEDDLEQIEEAIEATAPEIGLCGVAECPECRAPCPIEFDLYAFLRRRPHRLFEEVDQLAHHYHWSESQILTLPAGRRRIYLDLIDRRRGMHSHASQFV